jgi:type I restriction enzyme M protein
MERGWRTTVNNEIDQFKKLTELTIQVVGLDSAERLLTALLVLQAGNCRAHAKNSDSVAEMMDSSALGCVSGDERKVAEKLDRDLEEIIQADSQHYYSVKNLLGDNVFSSIDLGSDVKGNQFFESLIDGFSMLEWKKEACNFLNERSVCELYQQLISLLSNRRAMKGDKDSYTPESIGRLLSALLKIKEGDEVYDPLCGNGSLLIQCAKRRVNEKRLRHISYFGEDHDPKNCNRAKIGLWFCNAENISVIECTDALNETKEGSEYRKIRQFDVAVAGLLGLTEKLDSERYQHLRYDLPYGEPSKSKRYYVIIQQMFMALAPGKGRMAVIVPHGVLFWGGAEGKIRGNMIKDGCVDAVIGLPKKLYYRNKVPAVVLVMSRQKEMDEILFIDASRDFIEHKNQNELTSSSSSKIADTYWSRKELQGYSRMVSKGEIERNGYNLHIPIYIDPIGQEKKTDLCQLLNEREGIIDELVLIEKQLTKQLAQFNTSQ